MLMIGTSSLTFSGPIKSVCTPLKRVGMGRYTFDSAHLWWGFCAQHDHAARGLNMTFIVQGLAHGFHYSDRDFFRNRRQRGFWQLFGADDRVLRPVCYTPNQPFKDRDIW